MHSQIIIKGYREACAKCIDRIKEISVKIADKSPEEKRDLLIKCSETSLNSKIISNYKKFFSEMVVDAVLYLDEDLSKSDIGIKKITGGSVTDSFMVHGVCFRKTFSYAGFEQQPKRFEILKFWFFNTSLSLKLKKIMPKLELKTLMISKRLLMPNGILFTINLTKLLHQELKLSFPTFQLVILLLNTLLIKIFSVPVESKKMIYKEFPKHLEPFFKPPSTA